MKCPNCGHTMNHHADKVLLNRVDEQDEFGAEFLESYSCPHCGANASRLADRE
jgi:predicted RNA-binding Zn-ribbon protein involved in translation (DUF1610 family)